MSDNTLNIDTILQIVNPKKYVYVKYCVYIFEAITNNKWDLF